MYKGFISPATGDRPQAEKQFINKVYGGCRYRSVQANPELREDASNKSKCASIAWSQLAKKKSEGKL